MNYGFLSSAIMTSLSWDSRGKMFYLLDTFAGLDERYVSKEELQAGILKTNAEYLQSGVYVRSVEAARRNFSEWQNVRIIQGAIPETLTQVSSGQVAFLHIDTNCAPPEVAAAEFFWDKLVAGPLSYLTTMPTSGIALRSWP